MPFTEEELKKLRGDLPRGSAQILADKFTMSPGSVRNILSGLSNNDQVVIAAIDLVAEHQLKITSAKSTLAV